MRHKSDKIRQLFYKDEQSNRSTCAAIFLLLKLIIIKIASSLQPKVFLFFLINLKDLQYLKYPVTQNSAL